MCFVCLDFEPVWSPRAPSRPEVDRQSYVTAACTPLHDVGVGLGILRYSRMRCYSRMHPVHDVCVPSVLAGGAKSICNPRGPGVPGRIRTESGGSRSGSPGPFATTLYYAIVLPEGKPDFRAGFWPDCYRERNDICPPAGRRPAGGPMSVLSPR